MKKTSLAAAVALALAAGQGIADPFQMEGGLSYMDFDAFDDSALGVDFTYHFDTVATSGHPLNEAPFLERSNNLSVEYVTFDEADLDLLNVGIEAYFEDIYAAAELSRTDAVDTTNDIGLRLGYMIDDGFRVHAGVDLNDNDEDTKDINLGLKYVNKMSGDTAVNVEFDLTMVDDPDDTIMYDLAGDYYFNRYGSVGLMYMDDDNSATEATIGVRGKYFVTSMISVEARFTDNDGDNTMGLRGALRF